MEEHETKRSNHVFSDHYSFAIQTCRGIWRAAEASCEPANLGNAIIDIFVAKAPEYPKQVAALPMGADREQRGKVVFTHVRDVINMLELWDKVIPSVKTWRATVHKHEQNLGSRLAMRDFGEAVIEGIEKSSKARLKQGDKKRMYILMDIIVRESFEGSSV